MLDKENLNENEQKEKLNVGEEVNTAKEEAVVEQSTEEIVDREEKVDHETDKPYKAGFFVRLVGNIMDQTIALAFAMILYFVFEKVLPLLGYEVIDKVGIFLIMYIVANVLCITIIESTKLGTSVGKKILRIK